MSAAADRPNTWSRTSGWSLESRRISTLSKLPPFPKRFITAHDALVTQGGVLPGERVLIHAVGSGVGTAAVQLAHAMGCRGLGEQHGRPGKLAKMKPLGLDHGIDTSHEDFADAVRVASDGRGVDVLIDLLGGGAAAATWQRCVQKGRLVLVGLLGGSHAPLDLNMMLRKRLTMVGTTLRPTTRGKRSPRPGASPHRSSPGSSVDSYARSWIRSSR